MKQTNVTNKELVIHSPVLSVVGKTIPCKYAAKLVFAVFNIFLWSYKTMGANSGA